MDDEIETLIVGVRADTGAFARDAADMRSSLETALGSGADRAGSAIERGLARALRTGKLGFDDLRKVALSALGEIASKAVTGGIASAGGAGGGLVSLATSLVGGLLGLPGRATGGPVSPGRPYLVGERGPELFVPTSAGSIAAPSPAPAPARASSAPPAPPAYRTAFAPLPVPAPPARAVNVSVSIAAPAGTEPRALARSSRQVARAVADALAQAER